MGSGGSKEATSGPKKSRCQQTPFFRVLIVSSMDGFGACFVRPQLNSVVPQLIIQDEEPTAAGRWPKNAGTEGTCVLETLALTEAGTSRGGTSESSGATHGSCGRFEPMLGGISQQF